MEVDGEQGAGGGSAESASPDDARKVAMDKRRKSIEKEIDRLKFTLQRNSTASFAHGTAQGVEPGLLDLHA